MDSPIRVKTLAPRLVLLSAGLLVQSNTLFAAEMTADAQMQARDLLRDRQETSHERPYCESDCQILLCILHVLDDGTLGDALRKDSECRAESLDNLQSGYISIITQNQLVTECKHACGDRLLIEVDRVQRHHAPEKRSQTKTYWVEEVPWKFQLVHFS